MTLTTAFDPYRAAQAIADLDLIKAANPGCCTLRGVPYVALSTPTGIVLKKAGRQALPSTMTKAAQTWEDYRGTAEDLHKEANPDDGDPCWKGYEQVGTKKKKGKTVPNCVPMAKTVSLGGARYALAGATLRRV